MQSGEKVLASFAALTTAERTPHPSFPPTSTHTHTHIIIYNLGLEGVMEGTCTGSRSERTHPASKSPARDQSDCGSEGQICSNQEAVWGKGFRRSLWTLIYSELTLKDIGWPPVVHEAS